MKFLFVLFFILSCSQLPPKRTDKLSIVQGVTNSKEVEFSVVVAAGKTLRFELRSSEDAVINPDVIKVVTREGSNYAIHKMVFVRDPQKIYNLYVYEGDHIVDQRLVGRGQKSSTALRLVVASCMDDLYAKYFKIWDQVAAKNPDYILMIGDNVYADKDTSGKKIAIDAETLWKRYLDVRLSLPIYFQEKLIPIHAVWDDHDYGKNGGGEKLPWKEDSKTIFESFWAQDLSDDDWFKGSGVGGFLSLGDFNLYFLDGRYFRAETPDGRHLGQDQTDWLLTKLAEENAPSLIIKGDQFFGGYHKFDSFEGNHPQDFEKFVASLKEFKTPFIFVSGDRHMSEIMQFPRSLFGKPSFEITSSPIHGNTYPDSQDFNPWRVVTNKNHVNFTVIDNVAKDDHWFIDVDNIGADGELYYRRELAVFIKDLQNNLNETRKIRRGKRRYRRSRRGRR